MKNYATGEFPTLYKINKIGKINSWNIKFEIRNSTKIIISFKQNAPHGKEQIVYQTHNTTKEKDVYKLVHTIWKRKKREGYKDVEIPKGESFEKVVRSKIPVDLTDSDGRKIPMKAQPFKENKFTYPAILQPKINGLRGIVIRSEEEGLFKKTKTEIYSNRNKKYPVNSIINQIDSKFNDIGKTVSLECGTYIDVNDISFDGELYKHGVPLQEIRHRVHSGKDIDFYIFDIACSDMIQRTRLSVLSYIFNNTYTFLNKHIDGKINIEDTLNHIKGNLYLVKSFLVDSDEQAREISDIFIELGYEGGILRSFDGLYSYGRRSHDLMKFKKYYVTNVKIVDVIKADQDNYKDKPLAIFVCENDLNKELFKINPKGIKINRVKILENKERYIGQFIPIKFYERTKDKKPFNANVLENPKI